jgi:acetyl-CoA carboxylase biotin carboxyl carrier protein
LNSKEILELIDKVAESGISSVEVEQAGSKVRVEGKKETPTMIASYAGHEQPESPRPPMPAPTPEVAAAARAAAEKVKEDEIEAGMHIITSPIVGTFYRAPNPESDSFVNVGDRITKGKVLCIIEAMKLMNEIESEVEGVVTKIYPQNGQPVEFGEKLFAVKV